MQEYKKQIIIIGYSGHAYVILETINSLNHQVIGYIEPTIKKKNPYDIPYLGNDNTLSEIKDNYFFVAIGDNYKRIALSKKCIDKNLRTLNLIHPSASLSKKIQLGKGNFIARNVAVNDLCVFNDNIIINTGAIIDHEVMISSGVYLFHEYLKQSDDVSERNKVLQKFADIDENDILTFSVAVLFIALIILISMF